MRKGTRAAPYGLRTATPEDVGWIAGLESEVYSPHDAIPFHVLAEWHSSNPNGFNVIRRGNERVGHVDILPLRPAALGRILKGEIVERDIRGEDLYPPDESNSIRNLYVESIAIRAEPGSSSAPILSFILANFDSLVGMLCECDGVDRVYAIAASGAGESLMKHLGFTRVEGADERVDKHTLWGSTYPDLSGHLSAFRRRRAPRAAQ